MWGEDVVGGQETFRSSPPAIDQGCGLAHAAVAQYILTAFPMRTERIERLSIERKLRWVANIHYIHYKFK
jgi:hypothetical protein